MNDPITTIFALLLGAVVLVVPTVLMGLLIYHGEKGRWRRKRPPKRGSEVVFKRSNTPHE